MVWLKQTFLSDEVPKENENCTCIACITIDSVMRMEKKNYPQVYLEECKYKIKKTNMTNFIKAKLESESDSESELESDIELKLKSEVESDTDCNVFTHSNFVLNHRWWLTDFKRVEKLLVIFLTLNKSKNLIVIFAGLDKSEK